MTRYSLSSLGLALVLGGCTMVPHYDRPSPAVSATLPIGPSYGTPSPGTADVADTRWHDFFVDDRLRGVIALALANNSDLRIAVANVAQVRAQYHVQRAGIFPTIGANGSATFEHVPPGLGDLVTGGATSGGASGAESAAAAGSSSQYDIYQASVGISAWEVDLFGRIRSLTQAAQEQYFASADSRDAARIALIAQVANGWLTMAADQDRLRIAHQTADAFGRTLDITRGRASAGVASDLEVKQAQTSYDQARSDIASATTAVAQDQNMLNLLAGTTVPAAMLPDTLGTSDSTISDLPVGLSSDVLLRRPDVAEAEHQLKSANANIGAARAAFFPNVSLTAAFGTLSLGLSNLFGNGSSYWSVAPTATIPIFDFGRNNGNLHAAKASRDAMVASYQKAVQTAFREAADALARRGTIDQQLEAQTSLEQAAHGAYTIAQGRYTEGIDPFLNTLDAERSWDQAQQSLVATRLARQTNAVELYRALGGGLQ